LIDDDSKLHPHICLQNNSTYVISASPPQNYQVSLTSYPQ